MIDVRERHVTLAPTTLVLQHGFAVAGAVERTALIASSRTRFVAGSYACSTIRDRTAVVAEPAVDALSMAAMPTVLAEEEPPPELDRVVRLLARAVTVAVRGDASLGHGARQLVVRIHHALIRIYDQTCIEST